MVDGVTILKYVCSRPHPVTGRQNGHGQFHKCGASKNALVKTHQVPLPPDGFTTTSSYDLRGRRVGIAYELENGEIIYVPEE